MATITRYRLNPKLGSHIEGEALLQIDPNGTYVAWLDATRMLKKENAMNEQAEGEKIWAVVEVMGRARFAGQISEDTRFGPALLRVEVPAVEGRPAYEKHFGAAAIYSVTPCSEDVAREAARRFAASPITIVGFDIQRSLPLADGPDRLRSPYEPTDEDLEDYYEDYDDE